MGQAYSNFEIPEGAVFDRGHYDFENQEPSSTQSKSTITHTIPSKPPIIQSQQQPTASNPLQKVKKIQINQLIDEQPTTDVFNIQTPTKPSPIHNTTPLTQQTQQSQQRQIQQPNQQQPTQQLQPQLIFDLNMLQFPQHSNSNQNIQSDEKFHTPTLFKSDVNNQHQDELYIDPELQPSPNGIYTTILHYYKVFSMNVALEREQNRINASREQKNVTIQWTKQPEYPVSAQRAASPWYAQFKLHPPTVPNKNQQYPSAFSCGSNQDGDEDEQQYFKLSKGDAIYITYRPPNSTNNENNTINSNNSNDDESLMKIQGLVSYIHHSGKVEMLVDDRHTNGTSEQRVDFYQLIEEQEKYQQFSTTSNTTPYSVGFQCIETSFDRMDAALQRFLTNKCDQVITNALLGINLDTTSMRSIFPYKYKALPTHPDLPPLNKSQEEAIWTSFKSPLSKINGPPGTGKTSTCASLVWSMCKLLQYTREKKLLAEKEAKLKKLLEERQKRCLETLLDGGDYLAELEEKLADVQIQADFDDEIENGKIEPILVCAPSNVATDHLTAKIIQTGLKVVRVSSTSQRTLGLYTDPIVEENTLHKIIERKMINGDVNYKFTELHQQIFGTNVINPSIIIAIHAYLNEYNDKLNDVISNNVSSAIFNQIQKSNQSKTITITGTMLQKYAQLYKKEIHTILKEADVITTTCVGSGDFMFDSFQFPHVIIDEVSQTVEPELLIPITRGAKHVILIGDIHQLGPIVSSDIAIQRQYDSSLFNRLLLTQTCHTTMLNISYRCHPKIIEFSSKRFYDGQLQDGVTHQDRSQLLIPEYQNNHAIFQNNKSTKSIPRIEYNASTNEIFPWPNPTIPIAFLSPYSRETNTGTSKLNDYECYYVEVLLLHFLAKGLKLNQIGILTPYDGQRTQLLSLLTASDGRLVQAIRTQNYYNGITATTDYAKDYIDTYLEVCSVDQFQGKEKDLIIMSTVRTQSIGFLKDVKRLNVAITRAKYGFIMIGTEHILKRHSCWKKLLHFYSQHGCVVQEDEIDTFFQQLGYCSKTLMRPYRRRLLQQNGQYVFSPKLKQIKGKRSIGSYQ